MLTIRYMPDKHCLELKSLKEYLQSYRNLGIFQENIVNRVLEDVVRWAKPVWAEVKGDFRPRGGISTVVMARGHAPHRPRRGGCPHLPGGAKLREYLFGLLVFLSSGSNLVRLERFDALQFSSTFCLHATDFISPLQI